jgi:hypothetical protein
MLEDNFVNQTNAGVAGGGDAKTGFFDRSVRRNMYLNDTLCAAACYLRTTYQGSMWPDSPGVTDSTSKFSVNSISMRLEETEKV